VPGATRLKGWLGLRISDEELDEVNAMADELNAKAALEALKGETAPGAEGGASTFGPQAVDSDALELATAQVHQQWCPRGDSNTRPTV
jgi:hypothetical protein